MLIATIDCGTTNSRVYLVNAQGEILGKAAQKVGVRETAMQGHNQVLKEGLKATFFEALAQAGIEFGAVKFVISSGMITSEIGLIELPHLWAPVSLDDLAANLTKVHDLSIFPVDLPIYFVRGIKNRFDPATIQIQDAGQLDFMRGEETQVAGILALHPAPLPLIVVVLSSHTNRPEDEVPAPTVLNTEILELAYRSVNAFGFLRSLVITRFLDVLLHIPW